MIGISTGPILRVVAVALVMGGTGFSVPALAEESLAIEEIIVTARKKQESSQDVPIAMTALSAELRDSTVRNLADLNGYAPNVVIRANSGAGARTSQITIRGVTGTNSGEKSFDSPIAVSLDGVFFGTDSGRIIENFDLERVEVLRGPQGTLFGKNTVGGVINIFRSRPTGELGGKARVTAGRYGQQEIRALMNFPISETLAAKVFYSGIKADGFLDRSFDKGTAPEKDYENFGIALLWEPSDRFDALLTIERYNDSSDIGAPTNFNVGPGFFDVPTDGFSADFSNGSVPCNTFGECRTDPDNIANSVDTEAPNRGRYRNDVFALNMHFEINDNLSLVSVSAFHDTPYEDSEAQLDGVSVKNIIIDNDNVYEQFTQELRLEGSYEKFDFVVGGYYLDNTYDQDWVTEGNFWQLLLGPTGDALAFDPATVAACATPGVFGNLLCDPRSAAAGEALGPNFDQRLFQTQDTESVAVFAQLDYEITDKLVGTAGIRYTDEEKHFTGYQSYLGSVARRRPFNFDVPNADITNDWQETSLKFGLAYHYTEDMMFFASYSEGFKSGGFFGVNQNVSDFERNQYDPEFAKSYELGAKAQFMDNRLQVNAAGFYNDFKGKQDSNVVVDATTSSVATVFENIGSLEYTGLELELRFVATENLDLFATGGWLDAQYDEFLSLSFVPIADRAGADPQDVSGLNPKLAPEWSFGAGGTYTRQMGPGEVSLHAKWNYFSKQETDTGNDPGTQIPSQHFVNAQLGYEWDNFRVSVFGQNLTDETIEFGNCLAGGGPGVAFFCTGTVTAGRTWGVELEVGFGD
jgi:iron complex outermembrane receptor protein